VLARVLALAGRGAIPLSLTVALQFLVEVELVALFTLRPEQALAALGLAVLGRTAN
jgi:threonine/homoserine efflux transporter RhtA